MSEFDFEAPPYSWDEIHHTTERLRAEFNQTRSPAFPIMEFLEQVLDQEMDEISFRVGSIGEMGSAEGLTCPYGTFIELREDVYEAAWQNGGRARFTAAHELGHLILHSDSNSPLKRATLSHRLPAYRRCEPQANQFAAELLMPRGYITTTDSASSVSARHLVSIEAAANRIQFLQRRNLLTTEKDPSQNSSPILLSALGDKG
ncbi:ImmA/IrrE family metallo-endopeptidase [Thalassospira tepidiphila]|uniref:ImmA/IrrE family metallo-endopeptidase n=1 Tax=Thalassospira tepidiphila TaxID=393657 RepID=UPI001BCABD77|nr:ImmA/IrrE family metallo-endopeptidase [Thalassospira tepidiphila]MBS8275149.1 ImmA/IrrE family metallo-endopeptidase [Thalassospira tepidiphila]